jgi:hypothetical protein
MASSDGYEPLPQREGDGAYPPPPPSPALRDSKEEREQQSALSPPPAGSRRKQRVLVTFSVLVALLVGGSVGAVLAGTDGISNFWLSRSSLLLGCGMSNGNILCGDAYNQPGCESRVLFSGEPSTLTFFGSIGGQTSGAAGRKQKFGTSRGVTLTGKLEADSHTRLLQLDTVLANASCTSG